MSATRATSKPATWDSSRRGAVPSYQYSKLSEIFGENCRHLSECNVYGIVVDFKEPAQSRGRDFFSIVQIIDETSSKPLKVRLFHSDKKFFPNVEIGYIIRFHRLKVYKSIDVSLTSTKKWSWVTWDANAANDPMTYGRSHSRTYTLLESDRKTVERLREWLRENPVEKMSREDVPNRSLSEIRNKGYSNLTCMVISFEKVSNEWVIVKVCDGTLPSLKFRTFQEFTDEHVKNDFLGVPKEYVVDVSLYDNHVSKWMELSVLEGSYVRFTDLHAWVNPTLSSTSNDDNTGDSNCYELILHGGNTLGRGISVVDESVDEAVRRVINDIDLIRNSGKNNMDSQNDQEMKSLSQNSNSQMSGFDGDSQPQDFDSQALDVNTQLTVKYLEHLEKLSRGPDSDKATSDHLDEHKSTSMDEGLEMNDLPSTSKERKSITVVTGENIPKNISKLKEVINCEVPINESKYFRVKVQVTECVTARESYVMHLCPPTGLCIKATNTGEPLALPDQVYDFVEGWRDVFKMDPPDSFINDPGEGEEVADSQWQVPKGEGDVGAVRFQKYVSVEDGSSWESMESGDHVIRKRKLGFHKFTIMYHCNPDNLCTLEELREYGSSYDRVVRLVPLALLKSKNIHAVGIQNGVFYYASPCFAAEPKIPSIKYEAKWFEKDSINHAMGSHTLEPNFILRFNLRDDSGELDHAILVGAEAIKFFLDTTPESYLTSDKNVFVHDCVDILVKEKSFMECVIEKRSRPNIEDLNSAVYMYFIRNTRMKID